MRLLLLLCRWLFRLCGRAKFHNQPAKDDTKDNVMSWLSNLKLNSDELLNLNTSREQVEGVADMIAKLVVRILPRLVNNKRKRILDHIKEEARLGGEWDADILEVWPGVANMLEFQLQATVQFHSQIEAILSRNFLDSNPLLAPHVLTR